MRSEVRKILDQVEDVLLRGNQDSKDLAAILSALRGPDHADVGEKHVTTIPIRRLVFPRLAKIGFFSKGRNRGWSFSSHDQTTTITVEEPVPMYNTRHHFQLHVRMAKEAIERKDDFDKS